MSALAALRGIVADVDAPGHTIRNVRAVSIAAARAALNQADAATLADMLAMCERRPGEFWQRLAGSIRKAAAMV